MSVVIITTQMISELESLVTHIDTANCNHSDKNNISIAILKINNIFSILQQKRFEINNNIYDKCDHTWEINRDVVDDLTVYTCNKCKLDKHH